MSDWYDDDAPDPGASDPGGPLAPGDRPGPRRAPQHARPRSRSTARTVLTVVAALAGVGLLVAVIGGWWLFKQIDPGGSGPEVEVVIAPGSTTADIAGQLADQGVITNATVFEYYARWKGAGPFEAGRYVLAERSSMSSAIDLLEAGPLPPKVTNLTIPEGLWLKDIRARILATFPEMDAAELDTALTTIHSPFQPAGSTNLEGLLFPATYAVADADRADEAKLVRQMVDQFDDVAAQIGLADATSRLQGVAGRRAITPYEAVVVASMIEKETSVAAEKPKIARVIYNRLAVGENLGIDATVLYALGEHKEQLTRSDLNVDSPFNTRRFPGLPPTPIGAPGQDSLEAALNPAAGPWRYYVLTDQDGSHHFTDDYDDFLRAAADAQRRGVF